MDRFDLENSMSLSWTVTEDLKILQKRKKHMSEEDFNSAFKAVITVADLRFAYHSDVFEKCLQDHVIV